MTEFFYRQLAKAAHQDKVMPGQEVTVKVDLALAHDGSGPEIARILKNNRGKTDGNCRSLMTLDHSFPAPTPVEREFQVEVKEYARRYGIRLYKNGEGVLHQVVAEQESLWPGMIIVGADGHVATAGAFGTLSFSVSPEEFVKALQTCEYTLSVPNQFVISLDGETGPHVMARDIAMHLMSIYGDVIKGKAVLLSGTTFESLSISERMAICNFLPEAGVVTALVLPSGENSKADVSTDSTEIEPMLRIPGDNSCFVPISDIEEIEISVAVAGGCSAGRLDDMQAIADVLAKKEVHPNVTFLISPGSKSVLESMDRLKISTTLRDAGAVILPPGCGPCPGKHLGVLCDRDVAITTTIRNTPGRMGASGARVYLASPLTVAWSAVNGKISKSV